MKILVMSEMKEAGPWAIFNAFEWSVWLGMTLTGIAVGLIVYLVDHPSLVDPWRTIQVGSRACQRMWQSRVMCTPWPHMCTIRYVIFIHM